MNEIIQGDCLESLRTLPDKSVNCCVTSPPYYGLRSYTDNNSEEKQHEIGLEETPDEYVQKLVDVFREVRRVLRDDGTLWLNLGDSYAGNNSQASNNGRAGYGNPREKVVSRLSDGLKPKDLIGIPWRVAFALQSDGWYLRQDIIWHKPNPMPESVTDRCTKAHEYIFLLSKKQKYYYNADAIKEKVADSSKDRLNQNVEDQVVSERVPGKTNGNMKAVGGTELRNKRSVWSVSTKPFKEAHFATFPEDLIRPCILAGCQENGVVLDPFGGAGTTGVVATKLNRNYILCELNPAYIEIARKRIISTMKEVGTPDPTKAIPGQQINLF